MKTVAFLALLSLSCGTAGYLYGVHMHLPRCSGMPPGGWIGSVHYWDYGCYLYRLGGMFCVDLRTKEYREWVSRNDTYEVRP